MYVLDEHAETYLKFVSELSQGRLVQATELVNTMTGEYIFKCRHLVDSLWDELCKTQFEHYGNAPPPDEKEYHP